MIRSIFTLATVAAQQAYQIPNKVARIMDLYVIVGSVTYMPTPIEDPVKWKQIIASNLGQSDVPLFYYKQGNNKILLAPTPSSSSNTITFRGRLKVRDLNIADYTTGSVVSITNGATALVGTGTTWTADMVGRYIRITETDAANGGDGYWYEIGSYTSATSIGLLKPYQGTTIATYISISS